MSPRRAVRGEIWDVALDGPTGHELGGRRTALVVSTDRFNMSAAGLVVVLPVTSSFNGVLLHVQVKPPEGGVRRASWIKPEDVRSISAQRLARRRGTVSAATLRAVEGRLRVLLEL